MTMNIVEWAKTLSLEIVADGRGTVFYDNDRAGTPDTVAERFGFDEEMRERREINLKMFPNSDNKYDTSWEGLEKTANC